MAVTRHLEHIDLTNNSLLNFKTHPITTSARNTLGGTLGLSDEGIFVLDTDEDIHYFWDGIQWRSILYSDEKAQDAVGSILVDTNSIDFTYNDALNTIKADVKLSANTNNSLQILPDGLFSPVFPYPTNISFTGTSTKTLHLTLSNSTILTASFVDLNTGSGGSSGLTDAYISLSDGTNVSLASGPDNITFRTGNNLLDIVVGDDDVTYGDNILYTVNQTNLTTFVQNTVSVTEVRFKVGHVGSPLNAGDTTFTLQDCSSVTLTNKVIKLFIEGYRKYYGDDYVYNPTTGVITLSTPVIANQRFVIEAHPLGNYIECDLTSGGASGFPYDLPFDF